MAEDPSGREECQRSKRSKRISNSQTVSSAAPGEARGIGPSIVAKAGIETGRRSERRSSDRVPKKPLSIRRSIRLLPAPAGTALCANLALPTRRRRDLLPGPCFRALRLGGCAPGQPGIGASAWRHVQSKESREVFAAEDLVGGRRSLRLRKRLSGPGDELLFVHVVQTEEEVGLMVQPRADAIEHRRHMLAHAGPVRTTARELDLMGRREKTGFLPANPFHHTLREPALQKLDERIDGPGAVRADGSPARLLDRRDLHRNLVNRRTADQGFDLAGRDLKIDYGTVA